MMTMIRRLGLALLLGAALPAWAVPTLFSKCDTGSLPSVCVAGSNSSVAPTNPATPYQDLAAVTISSQAAGTELCFARGGSWDMPTQVSIANANTSQANPLYFCAYTPPWAAGVVNSTSTGTSSTTLTDTSQTWTTNQWTGYAVEATNLWGTPEYLIVASNTTNVLTFTKTFIGPVPSALAYNLQAPRPLFRLTSTSGSAERIFYVSGNNQNGFVFQDLACTATLSNILSSNGCVYVQNNSHTSQNVTIQRMYCWGMGTCFSGGTLVVHGDGFEIKYNVIRETNSNAILLASSHGRIAKNSFINCALSGSSGDHCIYGNAQVTPVGTPNPLGGEGNQYLSNLFVDDASGNCASVMLVVHDYMTSLGVRNNIFWKKGGTAGGPCYGIQVTSGNPGTDIEGYPLTSIENNLVINVGYVSIDVANCPTCEVINNVVIKDTAGEWVGIRAGSVANSNSANDLVSTAIKIANNTIYMPLCNTVDCHGIELSRDGTGNAVMGNLIHFGTSSAATCFYSVSLTSAAFTGWDYNLCYGTTTPRWANFNGTNYATRAAFTAAIATFDPNSKTGDPLWVATPALANLYATALQGGSPAVNACASVLCTPLGRYGAYPVGQRSIGADK